MRSKGPLDAATQDMLNRKLERINGAAQSSTLELMDRNGLAVAASNWALPSSYVGHNYAFRPYFSQTKSQGTGRFYAVGVTTRDSGVLPLQRRARRTASSSSAPWW